jgi:hypothetical protein
MRRMILKQNLLNGVCMEILSDASITRGILIAIVFFYLYLRKSKKTFCFLSVAIFLDTFIKIGFDLGKSSSALILLLLFVSAFILSLNELLKYEREGKSFAEFVDLDKYDYVVIIVLLLSWFFIKAIY